MNDHSIPVAANMPAAAAHISPISTVIGGVIFFRALCAAIAKAGDFDAFSPVHLIHLKVQEDKLSPLVVVYPY